MGSLFTQETAVQSDGARPGRYRGELSGDWLAPVVPQGGITAAVAARAMTAELDDPTQRLRSLSTVFAGRVASGPIEIEVDALRRGRSMTQMIATVRNDDEPAGATSIAVFGAARPGFEFTGAEMPEVPPPEQCRSSRDAPPPPPEDPRPSFSYWEQVESRIAMGHPWWEEFEPSGTERAHWYRFEEPPVTDAGTLDPLALVTLCDTMPGAVGEHIGTGGPFWMPPSADLTIHLFQNAGPGWLLMHNTARHAGDGYASVDLKLWDPERGLVAYATQMMFFVFPEGPPPA